MASVTIEHAHSLTSADAKSRLDQSLSRLAAKYGGEFEWKSDTQATLKHSIANATVRIEPARVVVDVEGGMALALVKGKVADRVRQELQTALGSPPLV